MPSVDSASAEPTQASLLAALGERLGEVRALHGEMRASLCRGDAERIDEASARLETVLLEFKLLAGELRRLPPGDDRATAEARASYRRAATELARDAAVGGGMLARLVALQRRLLDSLEGDEAESYLPSGRRREQAVEGLRLRERA